MIVVRGDSKRVVVVKPSDTKFFEQAIFIVREQAIKNKSVTPEQIVEEACRVAESYIKNQSRMFGGGGKSKRKIPLYFLAAAAAALAVWSVCMYFLA